MRVFISHQRADTDISLLIARRLRSVHGTDSYLDVIDPDASSAGDDLGDHVRVQLGRCTQLLAVVSQATRTSWWVPWEIGIATEKNLPLATFASRVTSVPEYLRRWPYLQNDADLDRYASASKTASAMFTSRRGYLSESTARERTTKDFFTNLRTSLGQ